VTASYNTESTALPTRGHPISIVLADDTTNVVEHQGNAGRPHAATQPGAPPAFTNASLDTRSQTGNDRGLEVDLVPGGEVVERKEHVDALGDRLGPLRLDRCLRVGPVLGVSDLRQRSAGGGLGGLGQGVEDVGGLVPPSSVVLGSRERVVLRGLEPEDAVVDGVQRGAHAPPPAIA